MKPNKRPGQMGQSKADLQAQTVMREFYHGRLRTPTGKKITNLEQAKAVAMQEKRSAAKRGAAPRTFMGRRRMRPILAKKSD